MGGAMFFPAISVQYSSVAQTCPTLCDPMNHSTPGLPVHHQLLELAQTHVHWVGDIIQPFHPLSSLLFLPSIFPCIRVFSNESALHIRWPKYWNFSFSIILPMNILGGSVQFSHSVVSNSLRPHEPQHARPPCPSPTPGVHQNQRPSSQWCHPTISSSVIPFWSCPQSFPASGSFQMSQLFTSGGKSIGDSASTSVLPINTQDWSALGWTYRVGAQ